MRRMRSILLVALFAAAAPMILAQDPVAITQDAAAATTDAAADAVNAATTATGDAAQQLVDAAGEALDGAKLPAMDTPDVKAAAETLQNAAGVTTVAPEGAVVINLTPGSKQGCYVIGEAKTPLAEFCEKAGAATEKVTIGGVDYQWVTGSLKNIGGKDICAFSTEPLKLAEPMTDVLKIVQDDASKNFEHLTLPTSQLKELKLPNDQTVNAQLLLPVDVSKITAEAPLAIPGATLSANIQPCEHIDGLLKPEQITSFTDALSKLAAPAASPEAVAKAATDATAAVADGVAATAGAAADATEKLPAATTDAAAATTDAAQQVADAAAKAGEALKPQGEGVEAEAISPANSLTASLAGLAAVAAAFAFQFVL